MSIQPNQDEYNELVEQAQYQLSGNNPTLMFATDTQNKLGERVICLLRSRSPESFKIKHYPLLSKVLLQNNSFLLLGSNYHGDSIEIESVLPQKHYKINSNNDDATINKIIDGFVQDQNSYLENI